MMQMSLTIKGEAEGIGFHLQWKTIKEEIEAIAGSSSQPLVKPLAFHYIDFFCQSLVSHRHDKPLTKLGSSRSHRHYPYT